MPPKNLIANSKGVIHLNVQGERPEVLRELKRLVEADGTFNPQGIGYGPDSPGLRRRKMEFAEVEGLSPLHPEYRRAKSALQRQRNIAEGRPALAPPRKRK